LRCISGALGFGLAASGLAGADAPAPAVSAQQAAYQSSIAQESIRKQTDQVQTEISELVTELNVNGLNDPTNLSLLSNAAQHLNSLSQDDMQKVINTLQSASMSLQDQDRQKSLVTASQGQKDILLKLKLLAADLAAEESQKEIPTMLQNLIVRQSANIRRTSTIPASATVSQLDAKQKVTHDMVSGEQSSIADGIGLVFKILSAKSDAPANPSGAPDTTKAVLDAMTNSLLQSTAQMATQLTTAGPFPPALDKQKAVRTYLIGFLRIAMSSVDPVTQLQQAKAQLDQVVSDQKDLADAAKQSKQDGATLAQRQEKISDDLSVTQAALQSVSPAATTPLDQAQQAMTKSSDALDKAKDPSSTAPQQQAVADALQKAEDTLDQQIASAEKQEDESPVDKMAQLQQLQNEINQAEQNPQTSSSDLQKLQQDAMVPAPQAADKIADAADDLQQQQSDQSQQPPATQPQSGQPPADQSAQPQSDQPPSDQSQANPSQPGQPPGAKPPLDHTAANQLLAQASADIQAQEHALKQAAQDYQALSQASQQLDQAQQETQAADQAMQNPANHDLTGAAQDLTQAQSQVNQMGQSPPPGGLPADSQQALQQAADALKNASLQAVQAQGAAAAEQGEKAEAAMKEAQNGLNQAMAQVQEKARGTEMGSYASSLHDYGHSMGQVQPNGPEQTYSNRLAGSGPRAGEGSALVVGGLKPKDRAALTQYQKEKVPPEYADQVQQYLKNLADASDTH
jgi:DNA polymerase III delta prime subunit